MPQQPRLTPEQYDAMEPDKVLRIMQIIAGALIAGVVSFAGVACFFVFGQQGGAAGAIPKNAPVMHIAIGFAVVAVVISFVLSNLIAASGVKGVAKLTSDGTSTGPKELFGRLLGVAQTRMILAMAPIEGAAFFNGIAFIITKSLVALGVMGALLLIMSIHFPTKMKLARWLEDQQRNLA